MKVVIHDRTGELVPPLREHAERSLGKLIRHFDKVLEAELHIDPESRREGGTIFKSVRIIVHMDGRKTPLLQAEATGRELLATLDMALVKVDSQVLKLKGRIAEHHHGKSHEPVPALQRPVATEPERVRQKLRQESVEQAVEMLESRGLQFHLFIDEETGEINVVYRRGDKDLGIIVPVLP